MHMHFYSMVNGTKVISEALYATFISFFSFFFLLAVLICFLFLMFKIIDLILVFVHSTFDSLQIDLYFS